MMTSVHRRWVQYLIDEKYNYKTNMMINQLITRGMGSSGSEFDSPGLATQGFGNNSTLAFVLEEIQQIIRIGGSSVKRAVEEIQEIVVFAKLIRVNNDVNPVKIEGFIQVKINAISYYAITLAEHISTRVRKAWEDVKISIHRLK